MHQQMSDPTYGSCLEAGEKSFVFGVLSEGRGGLQLQLQLEMSSVAFPCFSKHTSCSTFLYSLEKYNVEPPKICEIWRL